MNTWLSTCVGATIGVAVLALRRWVANASDVDRSMVLIFTTRILSLRVLRLANGWLGYQKRSVKKSWLNANYSAGHVIDNCTRLKMCAGRLGNIGKAADVNLVDAQTP